MIRTVLAELTLIIGAVLTIGGARLVGKTARSLMELDRAVPGQPDVQDSGRTAPI